MCQLINCESVFQYTPLYLSVLFLAIAYYILESLRGHTCKADGEMEDKKQETLKEERYVDKRPSRAGKDKERYARWKLTFKNNRTKVVVGYLSHVLMNYSDIKRYKEIK